LIWTSMMHDSIPISGTTCCPEKPRKAQALWGFFSIDAMEVRIANRPFRLSMIARSKCEIDFNLARRTKRECKPSAIPCIVDAVRNHQR
jgi:hypothetical protein